MRIKHFLVKMLLTVVLVAVGYISHAAINPQDLKTEIIDGLAWSYVVEDGYASVTSWNMGTAIDPQTTGEVSVPNSLGGFPVKVIGSYAFYQMKGVTSLTIPEGVEIIDFYMCRGCTGLKSVSLPSTLKSIGDGVFTSCESLGEVVIPDSVEAMGRDVFWGCKGMTNVVFSRNVKLLDTMTCYNCDSLKEITIPEGVLSIGVSAFSHCDNLLKVSIPATVETVGNSAFDSCTALESLTFPSGMSVINNCFSGCSSLKRFEISAAVSFIDPLNFYGCSSLTKIEVAESNLFYKSVDGVLLNVEGDELIAYPQGIDVIVFPPGIKRIGDYVFHGRRDLSQIVIPDGVVSIGDSAFDMCVNLSLVYFPSTLKTIGERAFFFCAISGELSFPVGFETIGEKAFMRTKIGSVVLPSSLKLVDAYAFSECEALGSLKILSSNCSVREYAFSGCPRLLTKEIAEGADVDSRAFGDVHEVEPDTPEVPDDDVEANIDTDCFTVDEGDCPTLVYTKNKAVQFEVRLYGDKGWYIRDASLRGEAYFANLYAGEYVRRDCFDKRQTGIDSTTINPPKNFCFAFYWMHDLGSGSILTHYGWMTLTTDSDGKLTVLACEVADVENAAVVGRGEVQYLDFKTIDHGDWLELDFQCIPKETEGVVIIPSQINNKPVRRIGEGAFLGNDKVIRITIPDTINDIGSAAFQYCAMLKNLEIPSSVTNVGESVIQGCDSLGELTINAALPTFGYKAFAHSGITNLVLASGITNINNYAFADNKNLKSVSIPQSVRRICKWSFDENCTSLRSVSVPYATVIEDEAFPPGCVITRYGPIIDAKGTGNKDIDEETKIALMRTLDLKDYESATCLIFVEAPPGDGDDQPVTTPVICAHLGISPYAVETWNDGGLRGVQYKMPTVEFVGIDPVTRTITGRVVPAEGTRIVSMPLKRVFGFYRIYWDEYDCQFHKGSDWGEWIYDGVKGFSVDVSNYVSSNGLFKIVFAEEVLMEKYPQQSHLFRIELRDRAQELW